MSAVSGVVPQDNRVILIKGAGVLTMDPSVGDFLSADILVRGGKIAEMAPEITVSDADVIDAKAMIAMPGFVDGHRHLWEGVLRGALPSEDLFGYFRKVNDVLAPAISAEDAYVSTLASALGALDAGITTMFDWSHVQTTPDHTAACIAALRCSGMRAVFGFGLPGAQDQGHQWPQDLHRLLREEFTSTEQLLSLALASVSPEHVPDEMAKAHFTLARDAGVIISVHSGMAGMGTPHQIERYGKDGRLGPDVNLVHCNALSMNEWQLIADTGTSVCITPSVEMQMGHGIPPIQQAMDVGVKPALGVDVETTAPNDMWTQMRSLFGVQRMNAFAARHSGKALPRLLEVQDVLEYATVAGAVSTRLDKKVGTLAVGKDADIILLRADELNVAPVNDLKSAVVLSMDARNVATVMVAGRILKRDGKLLGVDREALLARLYESRDRIFRNSKTLLPSPARRL